MTINFYNAQQAYSERKYLILEKIIEKQLGGTPQEISVGQHELLIKEEQQLVRMDNMLRMFNQPAQ